MSKIERVTIEKRLTPRCTALLIFNRFNAHMRLTGSSTMRDMGECLQPYKISFRLTCVLPIEIFNNVSGSGLTKEEKVKNILNNGPRGVESFVSMYPLIGSTRLNKSNVRIKFDNDFTNNRKFSLILTINPIINVENKEDRKEYTDYLNKLSNYCKSSFFKWVKVYHGLYNSDLVIKDMKLSLNSNKVHN